MAAGRESREAGLISQALLSSPSNEEVLFHTEHLCSGLLQPLGGSPLSQGS